MRAVAAQAIIALLSGAAQAAPYHAPPLTGHVVDTAGLLTPPERAALDRRMEEIRAGGGFELVAFLAGSLDDRPIEDVAYGAFNQWGIGRAGKDNGVLLVIAPKERKVRIETGKGVGGALTDVQSSDIIARVIAPPMREGHTAQAVAAGVDAIAVALTAGTPPPSGAGAVTAPAQPLSWTSVAVGGGILALLIILLIVSRGFRSDVWSLLQFFLLFRFLGGGRSGGGAGGGSGYSGGGGSSGGGGASGGY